MKDPIKSGACCSIGIDRNEEKTLLQLIKAISNPHRFAILKYLATHEGCINSAVVSSLPIAQSTTSQHLQVLVKSGLVKAHASGPATCYNLNPDRFTQIKDLINKAFICKENAC